MKALYRLQSRFAVSVVNRAASAEKDLRVNAAFLDQRKADRGPAHRSGTLNPHSD